MKIKPLRFILAVVVIFFLALIWNGLVHMLVLHDANNAINEIRRADPQQTILLALLITAGLTIIFVYNYTRWYRSGTLQESILHGWFFALIAGLLVDANQYMLYPLPATLAALWFVAAVIEYTIYSCVVYVIKPVSNNE